jgi:hypothetical protein
MSPTITMHALLWLALASPVTTPTRAVPAGASTRAEGRRLLVDLNREWGKARVAFDRATFERMLAPEFYVQLPDRRMARNEFLDEISSPSPRARLTRFDVEVLTVEPVGDSGDEWIAVIEEKLEFVPDGKPKAYNLWVTRDRWKRIGDRWMALSSEAIGNELWRNGEKPPTPNW